MGKKKDKNKLSPRQAGILEFIREYTQSHSRPPTIREIGNAVGISSTSVVNYNLNKLVEMGLLYRDAEVSRGLRLIEPSSGVTAGAKQAVSKTAGFVDDKLQALNRAIDNFIRIPLVGDIVASEPVEIGPMDGYYEDSDNVEISLSMLPEPSTAKKNLFALRVNGDSMIDAMVNHGDIVILQQQNEARKGDMVAVWIDNNTMTLKHYHPEPDKSRIRLQPAHPKMEPIYVDPKSVQVQGKVVMVVRKTA